MVRPQAQVLLARVLTVAVLAAAIWAVAFHTGVVNTDEAGVRLDLPDRVGDWRGTDIWHCIQPSCARVFDGSTVPPSHLCPACGKPLSHMNWAEHSMLPPDTGLVRKFYVRPYDPAHPITAAIVLSGDDRSSIHRPQVCMTAAGHEIQNERYFNVCLDPSRPPLEICILDMAKHHPESNSAEYSYYAYWFVGKDRETASHVRRMIWMASDRIFRGVSHRWAYIALSGPRDPRTDAHVQTVADFVALFHPAIVLDPDAFLSPDAPLSTPAVSTAESTGVPHE